MSGKSFCLASLVAAVLGLGSVRGQSGTYPLPSTPSTTMMAPGAGLGASLSPPWAPPPNAAPAPQDLLPSVWIRGDREPGCCGPTGRNGPIGYEAYFRTGLAFPVGGHAGLNGTLNLGWDIEIGARTLFFNPAADAAWTVDIGLSNVYNHVGDTSKRFPLFNVQMDQIDMTTMNANPIVTGSELNRTYGNLSAGREWYLWGSAEPDGSTPNWRVGFDAGGSYGTEKLTLHEIRHRTDTIAGLFLAVHSDIEVPWGCWIFQAGVRAQYGYTWSDILQVQNNSDTQEIKLLLTLGLRF